MLIFTRRTPQPATDSVALSYDARKRSRLPGAGAQGGVYAAEGPRTQAQPGSR